MTIKSDRNDSLLNSTYDLGLPQIVQIAPDSVPGGYKGDYNSMFKFLGEGDSAVFKLNLDTMAARTGQPKPEFADKFVTFTIKVRKHFKKGELTDSALYSQLDTYFKGELEGLQKAEAGKITKYVGDNKLEPKKTASGLQYVITEEGKGNKATFIIPSSLAYGDRPAGQKIPPYAPLIFDVELVDVIKGQPIANPAPGQLPTVVEPTN